MSDEKQVFAASRWTHGNLFFPVRIEVSVERVARIKPGLFNSNEESISISKVASVNIETGIFWSNIRIDSAGGTNPIESHGHSKDDARRIRDLIENYQSRNFTDLLVAFGCTGGRHRSIYCAERLARQVQRCDFVQRAVGLAAAARRAHVIVDEGVGHWALRRASEAARDD